MDINGKKTYADYRKQIYASINGTKGNLIKLRKSNLLSAEEKESLGGVIDSLEEFRVKYYNNRGKKNPYKPSIAIIPFTEKRIKGMQRDYDCLCKKYDLIKYLTFYSTTINPSDVIWEKVRAVILHDYENGMNMDVWKDKIMSEYRRDCFSKMKEVLIFNNDIDDPFILEPIKRMNSLNGVKINKIEDGLIHCVYTLIERSMAEGYGGQTFGTWHGLFTLNLDHVNAFFNSNDSKIKSVHDDGCRI